MELTLHPEYEQYQADQALLARMGPAVAAWLAGGRSLKTETAVFSPAAVRQLLAELVELFHAYNRVLWQEFDFCRQCRGGCCVVGASQVTAVDALALTVLNEPLPDLPAQTHHDDRACVYLGDGGCTWPARWRPLKCQVFYCLGSGNWRLDAADAWYGRLTRRLQQTVTEHWPTLLRDYEAQSGRTLADLLADPLHFAEALTAVLDEWLIKPLETQLGVDDLLPDEPVYPHDAEPAPQTGAFIAEMMDRLEALPLGETAVADLYTDLETLQWVAAGHPDNSQALLAEIDAHCAAPHLPESRELDAIRRRIAAQVSLLCEKMEN
ncbi:MAG: hypothetical protein KC441_13295 [Anaerolineales bacterium]|nr:hypothetical protein [Anaerolineales bacterium]